MPKNLSLLKDKLFENIFNNAMGGIAILNINGQWIKVNKSVTAFLGYSEDELYSMSFKDITHKDDLDVNLSCMKSLLKGDADNYQMEKRYFHKNGSIVWAKLSASIVRNPEGEPLYIISQIDDISKHKKDKNHLEFMLGVAKEQNSRLSSFAEIITHNLRTHASNLMTLVAFLEEESHELTEDENFDLLKGSVINLSQTVSHLTEVAKIKAIDESNIEVLNLYDYVNQCIYNVSALAKNIHCTIENEVSENHNVKAIPAYLDSIILNFLTNAVKYRSDKRDPVIKLSSEIQDEYAVFHIEDNGLGIDLDKFGDKLFQMYKTFHRNKDALGVGLFITKNHVESLGGHIKVKSEVNVGTTFSIFLKAG
ncbi:PAS domain S-box protein [Mariniflexile soesokkakense]|uniref:histidine kinase n=1 Tax=Mariniflexile soesokkakense TaxID=1343160 RepID=A0ABV0A8I4_9FLAO